MSNTKNHKDYGKYRRNVITWEESEWGKNHKYCYYKTPRDSKTAKYIIQTLGHRRRRAAERLVQNDLLKFREWNYELYCVDYDWYDGLDWVDDTLEFYDEGKHLEKIFSSPWDYY